jgi:Flp pilus assembly secretin CpaC
MFRISALVGLCLILAGTAMSTAQDNAPIDVKVNMARVLRISAPAATVIVGNPGIADVTIQDPQTLVLSLFLMPMANQSQTRSSRSCRCRPAP